MYKSPLPPITIALGWPSPFTSPEAADADPDIRSTSQAAEARNTTLNHQRKRPSWLNAALAALHL